jgi:hypothetical protein
MNTGDTTTKRRSALASVRQLLHGRSIAALAALMAVTAAAPAAWASATIQLDTTAPVLHIPSNVVADATGPTGAIVAYRVSAIDVVDGVVPVTCTPRPGSLFPIGDSIVICSARDSAGNTALGSFNLHVKGAVEQIGNLMAVVSAIGPSATALSPILDRALLAMNAGQAAHACTELATFGRAVYELAWRAQLTPAQAQHLIDAARRIRSVIGC